jgi:endoglucanase
VAITPGRTARTLAAILTVTLAAGCSAPSHPGPSPSPAPSASPAASEPQRTTPAKTQGPAKPVAAVRVAGNRFVDGRGRTLRLTGFNHSGAEYSCIEGDGFFDTPDGAAPTESTVRAMRAWTGTTAVRVPLNEQCWLGLPAAPAAYAGAAYRTAVTTFVDRLHRAGLVAVLDLHRSAPAAAVSKEQEQMPDRDHSVAFWRSVGATFADRPAVVFDLFNEPFPYAETNTARAWACWRTGGCTLTSVNSGQPYVAAGMNELIAAVRTAGARNVVLAGGIHWAEGMTQWLAYRPADPLGQLGASFHAYSFNDYCADTACYDRDLAPLIAKVPLYVGEIGPTLTLGADGIDENCPRSAVRDGGFAASTLDWLDKHGVSYAAWSWNPWPDCWALVLNSAGDPTPGWGVLIKTRLAAPD